ncbi:MAG: ATP-dependent RNA helicase dbp7 [Piccolia ochrophora]|nr:MAG: ATP-dependent RNA helicase dbp7 [Piccolia ochrophora]
MADTDGMLLNFSLDDASVLASPATKAAHWRDRHAARKASRGQGAESPPLTPGFRTGANEGSIHRVGYRIRDHEQDSSRPLKRQRVDREFVPASTTLEASTGKTVQPSSRNTDGVISSLFSYNPASKTTAVPENENDHQAAPSNAPLPDGISTFTNLKLSTALSAHLLTKMDVKAPTSIQRSAIPQLVGEDYDAFIQAETGSGKTLAYLLPIVQRIMQVSREILTDGSNAGDGKLHRDSGLFAIVLAPTRELCRQISVVLNSLLRCAHWIVSGTVIGGEKKKSEKARLRKGLNILVATPGRLADHLDNTKVLDVGNVRWLVLDEGDRLMELGFEEEILGIVKKLESRSKFPKQGPGQSSLPPKRVTVLCSATMKMNVQRLGEISLKDAVHLQTDPQEKQADSSNDLVHSPTPQAAFSAPAQLKQSYAVVPAKQRLVALASILAHSFSHRSTITKAIVFISCADSVDFHFSVFTRPLPSTSSPPPETAAPPNHNISIAPITQLPLTNNPPTSPPTLYKLHGSLPPHLRTSTLHAFTHSTTPAILFATDVASRGLDLPNVDLVLEYDPPFAAADHLHRVGRTARAGRPGQAVIFLLPGPEETYVDVLRSATGTTSLPIKRTDADALLKKGFSGDGGGGGDASYESRATNYHLDLERALLSSPTLLDLARRAFRSHVRAYATHVATERAMFDLRELHLGHLAKGFGLRERPGGIGQGVEGGAGRKMQRKGRSVMRSGTGDEGARDADGDGGGDGAEGRRKMARKMREHMDALGEFNIG